MICFEPVQEWVEITHVHPVRTSDVPHAVHRTRGKRTQPYILHIKPKLLASAARREDAADAPGA